MKPQRTVSFYHEDTGEFWPTVIVGTDEQIAINTPANHVVIDGAYDSGTERIDLKTGKPVPYTPPPDPRRKFSEIAQQISQLEAGQATHVRRALLGRGGLDELQAIDDQIEALRKQLE